MLTISQEDIDEQFAQKKQAGESLPTPLEFLLINVMYSPEFASVAKESFSFFTHEKVQFDIVQKAIIFGEEIASMTQEEYQENFHTMRKITEEDYLIFQNLIRQACGEKPVTPIVEDPNEDPRIRRIKEKARLRDRIKAKQGVQGGISLETCLISICCMGLGITPLNIGEMSYASISPLLKTYQDKEKYDLDIRSLLAGADSKKIKPKYWIRNSD